jgi:hypothetical protein
MISDIDDSTSKRERENNQFLLVIIHHSCDKASENLSIQQRIIRKYSSDRQLLDLKEFFSLFIVIFRGIWKVDRFVTFYRVWSYVKYFGCFSFCNISVEFFGD